ncbi:pyruvate dehydrogenase subunit beta [Kordiimonas sediminis]|uniref:Pyruvate dehydrogenase subunit beta n=1 Tax=Kordiimonas sediminis TaxID=1735581 RepID=A0A919AL55_9PROT|nr:transketolase C-terminal domain-containing protein [Kordiimonas sediminis]GHF12943.1 pyruvate dehydrogenase subunit beta [Kordiimonas sediminis]
MTAISFGDALNRTLHDCMAADDSIIIAGEDIAGGAGIEDSDVELGGVFGVTRGLAARFGTGRVLDTPITESAFVGMGLGAAATGLRPVIEVMFCDFFGVCFDQLINQAAKMRFLSNDRIQLPLVIRTTMGAGDGSGAMHSQSLHALVASVPGLRVVCPATPADAAGLLKTSIASPDPVIFMEHKGLYGLTGPLREDEDGHIVPIPLGKGRYVRRGTDLTLVATGAMVQEAEKAADILAVRGMRCEIIDPRTISPLDMEILIESVAGTGRLLVVDEGAAFAGFADAVVSKISQKAFAFLKSAPVSLTPPHTPVPYGRALEAAYLPSHEKIVECALRHFSK